MSLLYSTQGTINFPIAAGNTLVVRNISGTETVSGSTVAREDATGTLGSGVYVYGPQSAAATISISTTGQLDYSIVAGDPTPPRYVTVNRNSSGVEELSNTDKAVMGNSGILNKTALRRDLQSRLNSPAWNRARTYAEEIAAGATTVAIGRRFKHSNGQLFTCVSAGTIGTGEPSTWVPATYTTASPFMSPAGGGTAQFIAVGQPSRTNNSGLPAPVIYPLAANQARNHSALQGVDKQYTLTPTAGDSWVIDLTKEGPQTANQKLFRSPNARWWGGSSQYLQLFDWFDTSTVNGGYASGCGAIEADLFTDAIGFQFNGFTNGAGRPNTPIIFIDDIPLTEDPGLLASVGGGNACFVLVFPEGQSSHTIRIENPQGLTYVNISARGWITPSTSPIYRMLILGDSITQQSTTDENNAVNFLPRLLASAMGVNGMRIMQRGSTGYRQQSPDLTGNNHVQAYLNANPHSDWAALTDAVGFFHGNNDVTWCYQNQSAYKDMLLQAWSTARSQHPNAHILIKDQWSVSYNDGLTPSHNTMCQTLSNVMQAAFATWNDANSDFLPLFVDASGAVKSILRPRVTSNQTDFPGQFAWGNSGVGADYEGNSHWYVGRNSPTDSIHPTQAGNYYHCAHISKFWDQKLAARGK